MRQALNASAEPSVHAEHGSLHSAVLTPRGIGRLAIQALHQELSAYPKPGLVSPVDQGSHQDMDAGIFMRSLFALRSYFGEIAFVGSLDASFKPLKELGIVAEARMMKATRGINTHRGAIFNLGLLAAAAGYLKQNDVPMEGNALGMLVREKWGESLCMHGESLPKKSHGSLVASRYGAGGALQEASAGFPHVFRVALPNLYKSLVRGADANSAAVQCLFKLMAVLPDTNLLYRGGLAGMEFAQHSARAFLASGGVHAPNWQAKAVAIHKVFVARNLSPGGSADLLAATLFISRLQNWPGGSGPVAAASWRSPGHASGQAPSLQG